MMKKVFYCVLCSLLAMMLTTGCSDDDDETVETIRVASVRSVDFNFGMARPAYFVKENGIGEWQFGIIEGDFGYELGNEYTLKVTKVVPDPGLMDANTYYKYEGTISKTQTDSKGLDEQAIYNEKFEGVPVPYLVYTGKATLDTITVASVPSPEDETYYIKEKGDEDWSIMKISGFRKDEYNYVAGYEYVLVIMKLNPGVAIENVPPYSYLKILSKEQKDSQGVFD